MGSKILNSKALYMFLSILIAVVMWFYVTSLEGNEDDKWITNIPITFTGLESLERRGLMLVEDAPTASVRVQAAPTVLAKLNKDTLRLTVDVSQIQVEGQQTQAYVAVLPTGISSGQVEFLSGQTGTVRFTVARHSTRQVEIRGQFKGTVADGYLLDMDSGFLFSPETITISGQAELVNQVAYALVTVDGENLTESISGEYPYQLMGANGVLDDLDVECDRETVSVSYPILATAEIPLSVKLVSGGGANLSNTTCVLSEQSITVAGSKEAVAAIQSEGSLVIGTIDLATVENSDVLKFPVPLADELNNVSGVTEVTATIQINEALESKTLEVSKIDTINVPEGWQASLVTKVLNVTIRGKAELLEAIEADNVRVIVDLAEVKQVAGQYTLPATIYLDSVSTADQAGVIGENYRVVVNLTAG